MCKEKHSQGHNLINYAQKNYIYEEHDEFFHSYCYSCNKNMCTSCEISHTQHAIESFGTMISEKNIFYNRRKRKIKGRC